LRAVRLLVVRDGRQLIAYAVLMLARRRPIF